MLQVKSHYHKKIDELHSEIEVLARELQHTREAVEQSTKRRVELLGNIESLEDEILGLEKSRSDVLEQTQSYRKMRQKEVSEYDGKVKEKQSQIKKLEAEWGKVKERILHYDRLESGIQKSEKRLKDIESTILELNSSKSSVASEVSILNKEKRELEKEIEKGRGQADKILNEALLVAQDAHTYYETVGDWISAIANWHAVHGKNMPELLHKYKPKRIIVPSRIHKLLKKKQHE